MSTWKMTSLKVVPTLIVGTALLVGCSSNPAVAPAATPAPALVAAKSAYQPRTREFLLTMWGMKPYAKPAGEKTPSITDDGKWTNLPVGPEASTYATVHHFVPDTITVHKGDTVKITVLNLGLHNHGFAIPEYGIDFMAGGPNIVGERGDEGKGKLHGTATGGPNARTITFVADKTGVFEYMCNLPFFNGKTDADKDCNPMHDKIKGELVVLDN
jgi:plastocyanin